MDRRILVFVAILLTLPIMAFGAQHMRIMQGPGGGAGLQAGGGPGGPGPMFGLPPELLAQFLNLTEAQKTSWEQIRTEAKAAIDPLVAQQQTLHAQLDQALSASNPDSKAIGDLMISIRNIGNQIRALHESADQKFAALLTADQKAKWDVYQQLLELVRQQPPQGPRP